jgi:hypothetical protein
MTVIEVAAGVLLALVIRRIAAVLVLYAWFRWAYTGDLQRGERSHLLGWPAEGVRHPAWLTILRRIVEGWPRR